MEDWRAGSVDWGSVGVRDFVLEKGIRGYFPVRRVRDEEMETLSENVWADPAAEYEVTG